jgi:methyl-accepting chemotaxis protein
MRQNLPVTDVEILLEDGDLIVSMTDLKGRIVYVNATFLKISGYTEAELLGKAHNIIRHPDMPPAAFADLWATLKAGRPWMGMVKNRCSNGDYYWVQADVAPVYENGTRIGYMSVRRKPGREQVAAAEAAYARVRAGTCTQEIRQGSLRDPAPWHVRWNPLWRLALRTRLMMAAGAMGLYGLALAAFQYFGAPGGVVLATIVLCTLLACYCARWLARDVIGRLEEAGVQFRRLASGLYDGAIAIDRDDEIGSILLGLKCIQVRLGFEVQDAQRRNAEAARITRALDVAGVNMMIANDRLEIIYVNPAMRAMLAAAADDLRSELPGFSVDALAGSRIDRLHPEPERQRALLFSLDAPRQVNMVLGGRRFELALTPVFDEQGARVGTVAEWRDLTMAMNSLAVELNRVVGAAARGDFGQRIGLDCQDGPLQLLGQGVNELLASTEASLRATLGVLAALAEGDLRPRIDMPMEGLFQEMKDSTNATLEQLARMVQSIRDASRDIHVAAHEIDLGNADLAARTEIQAVSIEQTAASMDKLTGMVRQCVHNASQADGVAGQASAHAHEGDALVGEVATTMADIQDASTRVGEIVAVIDGIAFQTNLLALNAAVEAARAGEQGKGFAVVATEVRSLAQRCAAAAAEVKQLIGTSTLKVAQGHALVDRAGQMMRRIVDSTGEVSRLMSEISDSTAAQYEDIERVNRAIGRMDDGTRQNAALVEEASASAHELEQQAANLVVAVEAFLLEERPSPVHAACGMPGAAPLPA